MQTHHSKEVRVIVFEFPNPSFLRISDFELVAREGIAPSTSLCRRDMILFHHRAVLVRSAERGMGKEKREPGLIACPLPFRTPHSPLRIGKVAAGDGFAPP